MTAGYYFVAMGLVVAFGSQWAKRHLDDKTSSSRNGRFLLVLFTLFGAGLGAVLLGIAILILAHLATAQG